MVKKMKSAFNPGSKPRKAPVNLSDKIYESIRQEIFLRELMPGSALDEMKLAERFNVSRTPIREALQRLEKDGLVITAHRRGAVVRRPTLQDLIEIDQIRRLLEPAAARMAAGYVDVDELNAVRAELEIVMQATELDVAAYLRVDAHVHQMILDVCGNNLLRDVVASLHNRTKAVQRLTDKRRVQAALVELLRIVDALRRSDGEAAEAEMLAHLQGAMRSRLHPYRVNRAGETGLQVGDAGQYMDASTPLRG